MMSIANTRNEPAGGRRPRHDPNHPERGTALLLTLVLLIGLTALTAGGLILSGTERQLRTYSEAQTKLGYASQLGVEMGLSRINLDESALPDTGYNVLESNFVLQDAAGDPLDRVSVNIYAARTGSATGRTGNFASVVGEAVGYGTRVVTRLELTEESFAKYAYFSDNEGGNIWFGGGDELFGPVHSNDQIKIHSTGATFHDQVTTSKTILYPDNGTFLKGYQEGVDSIPLPDNTDLARLAALASAGNTNFAAPSTGAPTNIQIRIEFVAIDLNGDGDVTDPDEGFFRVYRSTDSEWVGGYSSSAGSAGTWTRLCGDYHTPPGGGDPVFVSVANHQVLYQGGGDPIWTGDGQLRHGVGGNGAWNQVSNAVVATPGVRCLLGGDPRLTLDNATFDPWDGTPGDAGWIRRADVMPAATLPAALAGRPDAPYLMPLDRNYNPEFRGIIYFDGLVGVSGVLNGRITLVSSDNIVLLDDFKYSVPANADRCNDIAGFLAANNFYMADNLLNAPDRIPSTGPWRSFDDTDSEFLDGVILALNTSFRAENFNTGPTDAQVCETRTDGRGCLYLTGGLIQETRGPVGLVTGQGYIKRYAYDANARFCPPPHFPTTGKFVKNRFYQVNPDAFQDVGAYFAGLR